MSVQASTLLPAVSVWINNSLLCPLPVHNALMTFLKQQAMSGRSSLPSVRSPIPRCWGSLRGWSLGRGHLSGCRAPPGGCCYLWSLPSPESMAQGLALDRRRWEYRPAARLPWRSSGSAPWRPRCVLKVTKQRGGEYKTTLICTWGA